jgi:thioredoxin 1
MAQQLEADWFAVLRSPEPVLVDFYADWCGPCRRQAPVIDALAVEGFKTVKANVNVEQELADAYRISVLPTLLIFRDGEVVDRLVGFHDAESLREAFKRAAAGGDE